MSNNQNLHKAKAAKNDEFYTQLPDIEKEFVHYREFFKDKVVLCNCDDPRVSNFFHYFSYNFHRLGLKKLITTCYKSQERDLFSQKDCERAIWLEYDGRMSGGNVPTPEDIGIHHFRGDGDFRSQECIELLKQADVVVSNPPFSLFREFIATLEKYNKKYLIIGNQNAIGYKEIFPLIRTNKLWLGITTPQVFVKPDGTTQRFGNICWFTNIPHYKRNAPIILTKHYTPERYPKYDNYDAINVDKTLDIPMDYRGVIGVPISFLDKYCPEQFEIVSFRKGEDGKDLVLTVKNEEANKIYPYSRILIRKKN